MKNVIGKALLLALSSFVYNGYADTPENTEAVKTPVIMLDRVSAVNPKEISSKKPSSFTVVKYVRNISNPNGFGESFVINDAAFYSKSGEVKADSGDKLEYAIIISAPVRSKRDADLEAVAIKDFIPAYTEYLPDSTTINTVKIADINGQFPLLENLMINDASSALHSGIIKEGESATVMFRVRVNLMQDLP